MTTLLLFYGCVPYYPVVGYQGRNIIEKEKIELGGGVSIGHYIDGGLNEEFQSVNSDILFDQEGFLAAEYGKPAIKIYLRRGLFKDFEAGIGIFLPYDIGLEVAGKYAFWKRPEHRLNAMTGLAFSASSYSYTNKISKMRGEKEEYRGKSMYFELPVILNKEFFENSAGYCGFSLVYEYLGLEQDYFLKKELNYTTPFSSHALLPKLTLGLNISNGLNTLYFELNILVVKDPDSGIYRTLLFPGFSFSNIF